MIEKQTNDGIVTLRLAHGKASALDVELRNALTNELRDASSARAVIITGTGSIFSAGVDLFRMTNEGAAYVDRFVPTLRDVLTTLFEFPRPIVAAVNGHAIAGGCLIAAACDVRLMCGGKIGVPELLVGVPFPAIAIQILQYAAGRDAIQLAYSAATFTPEEARAKGLIDEVVAPDQLMTRAEAEATRLASIPSESFRLTKLQLRRLDVNEDDVASVWRDPEIHTHIKEYLARTIRR